MSLRALPSCAILAVAAVLAWAGKSAAGPTESEQSAAMLKRAQQGEPLAQWIVGESYMHGLGVPKDAAEGMRWLLKAANAGQRGAQLDVAHAYLKGDGVAKDPAEAVRWERQVASGHDVWASIAEEDLGAIYRRGLGAPPDRIEASRWYRKAAAHGSANAELQLAQLYEAGVGGPPDLVDSYAWYLAVIEVIRRPALNATGIELKQMVDKRMAAVASQMTPEQLAIAKRLARRLPKPRA